MAINGFPRLAEDDELDVPDFMKPGHSTPAQLRVIPGQLIDKTAPADGDEDIAPGLIEYVPARTPALHQAGSAAMVVAASTGRVVGLSARRVGPLARYFGTGLGAACILGWRYVRAHDLQEVIGGMNKGADWNKVTETRRSRWKLLGRIGAAVAGVDLVAWWALVKYAGMTALDYSWAVAPGIEALATGVVLTLYGRYRLENRLAPQELVAAGDIDDGEEPFPLAWCEKPAQVEECLSRALAYEGIDTRRVGLVAAHKWGKELEVDLKGATPGKVQAAADQLETHMALPDGGFMMEPIPSDKSKIVVRLVQTNPFADMLSPAVHAPRSLSVHDTIAMGRAMDGSTFELTLDGFCALVIGAMGAGKTLGALRTLAEALTACRDAVCWDLDPIKGGLTEFGDLMEVRARGPEECEQALERALAYVTARSKVMPRIGMGDRWHASEKHPHLFIFIDEYLQMTKRGKELAIQILRTGRQYGIYLVIAGQEATADALGDAIAAIVAFRILMACRFEDVRIAFGPGAGAQGWRPDRMKPAVGPMQNDAGQAMIMGGLFNRAIRYRFNAYSREQIAAAVPERVAAGVTRMDADTLLEAGESLASTADRAGLADRLRLVDDARALKVASLLDLYEDHEAGFLPTSVIVDEGIAADGSELQELLVQLAPMAKSAKQYVNGRQVRGWERTVVEQAAAALIAPSCPPA